MNQENWKNGKQGIREAMKVRKRERRRVTEIEKERHREAEKARNFGIDAKMSHSSFIVMDNACFQFQNKKSVIK